MMTTSLEKINQIDKLKLNDEFYFSSLVEECYRCGLLDSTHIEKMQFGCLELLALITEQYTGGESSSILIDVAQNLMKSNFYTLGVYLKSIETPELAIEILKEKSIKEIYFCGLKLINVKLKTIKFYHNSIVKNMLKTENYAYNDTLIGGINGFLKLYSPDYSAHETNITADYPVCNTIRNLVGVELIQKYLENIKLENEFCCYFSADSIHHLMCGYDEHYEELIINIFEQVLTSAISCILIKTNVENFNITATQVKRLEDQLLNKLKAEIYMVIKDAANQLIVDFGVTKLSLKNYIINAISEISINVFNAVKIGRLSNVFIVPKY